MYLFAFYCMQISAMCAAFSHFLGEPDMMSPRDHDESSESEKETLPDGQASSLKPVTNNAISKLHLLKEATMGGISSI